MRSRPQGRLLIDPPRRPPSRRAPVTRPSGSSLSSGRTVADGTGRAATWTRTNIAPSE